MRPVFIIFMSRIKLIKFYFIIIITIGVIFLLRSSSINVEPPESSTSPDEEVFKYVALTYAQNHPEMRSGKKCSHHDPDFPLGITNGAAWYELTGT